MQGQLEREAARCGQLEVANGELKERLASLQGLGRSNQRLEEQLEELRRRSQEATPTAAATAAAADPGQAERYRREADDRASLQIRQKLDEVNVFLQVGGGACQSIHRSINHRSVAVSRWMHRGVTCAVIGVRWVCWDSVCVCVCLCVCVCVCV